MEEGSQWRDKTMEIERKYLIDRLPDGYERYPFHEIEQAYLCTDPVVRIRRSDDEYYLTYKGKGLLVREEYNLPLTKEAYLHLLTKADGIVLTKRRYLIPLTGRYEGLVLAEVEFEDEASALSFTPPSWFGRDVTFSGEYQNSKLSHG
jgi:CYTH domain-containing protein